MPCSSVSRPVLFRHLRRGRDASGRAPRALDRAAAPLAPPSARLCRTARFLARASAVALADREAEQTWSEDSSSDDDLELSYFPRRRGAAGHHASALEMHAELVSRQAAVAAAAATSDDDLDLRPQVLDQDG